MSETMSDKRRDDPKPQPSSSDAKAADASGELDLEIEEIQRPELMKEGFVGQER